MKKKRNALRILAAVFTGVICLAGGYVVGSYWGITELRSGQLLATDYGMNIRGTPGIDDAYVLDGLIDYSRKSPDGSLQTISLGAGQMSSAFSDMFQPIQIPPSVLSVLQESLGSKKLRVKKYRLTIEKAK